MGTIITYLYLLYKKQNYFNFRNTSSQPEDDTAKGNAEGFRNETKLSNGWETEISDADIGRQQRIRRYRNRKINWSL